MVELLRHLLAIAAFPFTATVLVPVWIARRYAVAPALGRSAGEVVLQLVGCALFAVGLPLFLGSFRRFATEGKGTLAPWDPPRALVLRGPYRFVRNPMISGVIFVLFGHTLALLSLPHGVWATAFLILNLLYSRWSRSPNSSNASVSPTGSIAGMFRASCPGYVRGVRELGRGGALPDPALTFPGTAICTPTAIGRSADP